METVTCQLMWAGAKEAANYSPTCKYSWRMIVLIWTSAILIKYFYYFWDRLLYGGGEVVKGINLFTAENMVVIPGNCSRRVSLKFPHSFLFYPVFDLLSWHLPSSSACLWSPLDLCACQFLKITTYLPPPAGRYPKGRDEAELLARNQGGLHLRPECPDAQHLQKQPASISYTGFPISFPVPHKIVPPG